jgi:putative ABC transport system ATP-binding protein
MRDVAPAPDPGLFAFEGVRVVVDGRGVLDGVDGRIPDAGVSVLLGASGSGKSTLLRLCNRLESPTSGRILFRGGDLTEDDPLAHRRRVGMVFQQPIPFGGTVRDNLLVASTDATEARMARALERAHLPSAFLERPAGELSGGECQRACLARTLVTEPEVLLMDEPTSALDEDARLALERLARELADDDVPVIWVTHDLDQAHRLADWVIVLAAGRVEASGVPSDVAVADHLRPHSEARAGG